MPRITSGSAKNRNIEVPDIENIRLVQDKTKLSVFSILGDHKVQNKTVLDLYAGSGSLGLEALSRGAARCDFVDEHKKAVDMIQKNLATMGFLTQAEVFKSDSIKFVANTHKRYDLIFADPFYNDTKHKFLMQNLEEALEENGVIVFLHGENLNIEEQISNTTLKMHTQRRFGAACFTVLISEDTK